MLKMKNLPIDQVYKKRNIREEAETELADLAASIDAFDLLQPILVRPVGLRYEIISGHRRYLALKIQGAAEVPCVIRDDLTREDIVYVQLSENTCRKQMSAAELVDTFDRLKEESPGLTNAGIAKRLGRDPSWVANQYGALAYAQKMKDLSPEEKQTMTAGQLVYRAKKAGLWGVVKTRGKVKVEYRDSVVRVTCKDTATRQRVVALLEKEFG